MYTGKDVPALKLYLEIKHKCEISNKTKKNKDSSQKIDHPAEKLISLYHEITCINEDVKPSYSTSCSVSTKLAVAPSRFAPLLHILVPAMNEWMTMRS